MLPAMAQLAAPLPWPYGVKAAVAITFDDNCPGQFTHARPALDAKGYKGTFFVITGGTQCGFRDWDTLRKVAAAGHEIASHSVYHTNVVQPQYDTAYIGRELRDSYLELHNQIPNLPRKLTYAWPFGRGGGSLPREDTMRRMATQYYLGARNASSGLGWDSYNHYLNPFFTNYHFQVGSFTMGTSVTGTQFGQKVRDLEAAGGLMTLLYHGIETGGFNNIPAALFQEHLDTLANHPDLWITTFRELVRYHKAATSVNISPNMVIGNVASVLVTSPLDTMDYPSRIWVKLNVSNVVQLAGGWGNFVPQLLVNNVDETAHAILGQDSIYALVPSNSTISFGVLTSQPKATWNKQLKVFPQPAHGTLNLVAENGTISHQQGAVQLLSLTGTTVLSQMVPAGCQQLSLNIGHLASGTYIMKLTGSQNSGQRLVVIR